MGLFDGLTQYLSDPENAARVRGALIGAGQAAAQPYGNLGSIAAGAGQGQMTGINNYYAQQQNKYGLANDQLGMQQKLGSVNFMRQIQGLPALTQADVMKGSFGTQAAAPLGMPAPQQSAPSQPSQTAPMPSGAPMGTPPLQLPPVGTPLPTGPQGTAMGHPTLSPAPQAIPPQATSLPAPQPSQAQSIIPPELMQSPIFQAALQSGDSATVMSMLTKHQTQLTPQELQAANLPADSLAFKAPDGTLDIKRQGSLKTPAEIAQAHKTILTPQEVAQAGLRPGTIAERDLSGNVNILQASDVKSAAAEAQDERISAADAKAHQTAMIDLLGPDYIDNQAKAIATYRAQPQQSSRNPAVTAAIMGRVYEINPNYDAKQFNGANRAVTAFDTGKQGDQVRSFNTSIAHLNTLQDLTTALKNGDIKALNAAGNAIATQLGKPAPTNFEAAKNIVGDEIIKAIVGGGGALADRENAANQISAASSPAQLLGVIQTYKNLMAGQLVSLKRQYQTSTKLNDFDEKLLPETQKELGNLTRSSGSNITAPSGNNYVIKQVSP